VYLQLESSPHPAVHYCLKSHMPHGTMIGFSIEISDPKDQASSAYRWGVVALPAPVGFDWDHP